MNACIHWQNVGAPKGGRCVLHEKTCSFGVCRACLDNTAAPDWPGERASLTSVEVRGTKGKPCGDCRTAELIRKSKEKQI